MNLAKLELRFIAAITIKLFIVKSIRSRTQPWRFNPDDTRHDNSSAERYLASYYPQQIRAARSSSDVTDGEGKWEKQRDDK